MPDRLQTEIRERAAERDAERDKANPTLSNLFNSARGEPLQKRRKARPRLVQPPRRRASAAPSVRSALRKAAGGDAAGPVALMLGDMARVLEEFRKAEGREPTERDRAFWQTYKRIMADRLGA